MKHFKMAQLQFPSPAKTLCLLLVVIFAAEYLIMRALPPLLRPGNAKSIADAALLAVLCAPVLYRYVFRPFRQVAGLQKSLAEEVLEQVVDGVVLFDWSLEIQYLNAAAERMFGYGAAELAGCQVTRLLDDAWIEGLAGREGGACELGGLRACTGLRKGGETLSVEFSVSRVQHGGSWMWLGIIRDISTRTRDDQKLKETLSLLSATLEATADGVMVRDLQGNTVIANRRFGEMWHVPEEVMETHNDKLTRAFVLEQLQDPQAFLAITEGQYQAVDGVTCDTIHFKDGRVYQRFAAPQVVDDAIVGRVICYRDVTAEKNLEHQLRHAQKMEALGTLAGGVAHDFNNILTVIMGFCSLTSGQLEPDSPLRHYLDQILSASERALTLTNSLLAYSRKQVMNKRPVEINCSIRKTQTFLARLIGEDVELVTGLGDEPMVVMADSGQLEQVLMNLAANARDAMARKGSLSITTKRLQIDEEFVRLHGYGKPGAYAHLAVSDTGMGMDAATREKIFEPFFTTKEVGHGTGLGLSIAYGIVKQHDGHINVYSEPGKGTTFNIYLPLVEGVEEAPCAERPKPRGGEETILVAEDDSGVRALVKLILGEAGYRVVEAQDGEEAVERFRQDPLAVDLLLFDVVMPKKNGKEALQEIQAIRPGMRAVFMSGYTADIVDRNGLMKSGTHLLSKPLQPSALLGKVREVLDGREQSGG